MTVDTLDDASSIAARDAAEPAIVVIASGAHPSDVVLEAPATLGRSCTSRRKDVELPDERMSKSHAKVSRERDAWLISDLDSRNGTFVDGLRISGQMRVPGDAILRLGHTVFALLADGRGHPARHAGHRDVVVGPELERAFAQIRANADVDALLVHAESGAGKELAARLFHEAGPRSRGPFVAVNCAAIPEGVAERLLFGSRRGAFSGAVDAQGYFQSAAQGTLFLDEIAELDPAVQAKLLRALETREVVPIGASSGVRIELGVVAASHRELRAAVADRSFREDLYYRLARAVVHLPPLRERRVDLARLVERELARVDVSLAPHAKLLEACLLRPWPGNVRELQNAIRQAASAARTAGRTTVRVEDLADHAGRPFEPTAATPVVPPRGELQRETIVAALAHANGVVSIAARELGLHRTQLYRLMDRLGISRDADR